MRSTDSGGHRGQVGEINREAGHRWLDELLITTRESGLNVANFFDLLIEARNLGFYVNSSDYVCVLPTFKNTAV